MYLNNEYPYLTPITSPILYKKNEESHVTKSLTVKSSFLCIRISFIQKPHVREYE